MHLLPFKTIKTLTLRMDHAKLLDVLTSLPVSRSILPRAVCFATSHPANHAICSFIDSSGYASGPIRRCLFIDYIIMVYKSSVLCAHALKARMRMRGWSNSFESSQVSHQ